MKNQSLFFLWLHQVENAHLVFMRQDLYLLDLAGELKLQDDFLWILGEPGEREESRDEFNARNSLSSPRTLPASRLGAMIEQLAHWIVLMRDDSLELAMQESTRFKRTASSPEQERTAKRSF
jgi:hypothetical protein